MQTDVVFDVCPETGIGSLMLTADGDPVKLDLMPDEVGELRGLVESGDMAGVVAALTAIDPKAESILRSVTIEELAREVR